jgi:hypothetical protein
MRGFLVRAHLTFDACGTLSVHTLMTVYFRNK